MVRNKMHVESPSMKSSPYLQDKCSAHLPLTFPRPLLRIQIAWISHWDNCQWPIMWPVFQVLATIGSLNSTISKESAQVVLEPVARWRYPPGGDTNKGLVGLTLANSADRNCGRWEFPLLSSTTQLFPGQHLIQYFNVLNPIWYNTIATSNLSKLCQHFW